MEKKYIVGIDFGAGETAAKICTIGKEAIECLSINQAQDPQYKKVWSSFAIDENGNKFLTSESCHRGASVNFKRPVNMMSDENREAMAFFVKAVIARILQNNGPNTSRRLIYDEQTGERNFYLCIACPSRWDNDNPKSGSDYLNFLNNSINPKHPIIDWTIKESDAAFFSYTKTHEGDVENKSVLIVDLGHSTVDYTAYSCGKMIDSDGGESLYLGAKEVEDTLLRYFFDSANAGENLKPEEDFVHLQDYRHFVNTYERMELYNQANHEKVNIVNNIRLELRRRKEDFYTQHRTRFTLQFGPNDVYIPNVIFGENNILENTLLNISIDSEIYNKIISPYSEKLKDDFIRYQRKLKETKNFTPELVVLTGGASKMPFVIESLKDVFKNAEVIMDNEHPDYIVADGIVRYANESLACLNQFISIIDKFDYKEIYAKADIDATNSALKFLLDPNRTGTVLYDFIHKNNANGSVLHNRLSKLLGDLANNKTYIDNLRKNLNNKISNNFNEALSKAVFDVFKVNLESELMCNIDSKIMSFTPSALSRDGRLGDSIKKTRFSFTWDLPRDESERINIANNVFKDWTSFSQFDYQQGFDEIINELKVEAKKEAVRLYETNQLFATTYKSHS